MDARPRLQLEPLPANGCQHPDHGSQERQDTHTLPCIIRNCVIYCCLKRCFEFEVDGGSDYHALVTLDFAAVVCTVTVNRVLY